MSAFPSAAYDKIAAQYDESRGGLERGDRFARVLDEVLAAGGCTLELGVGTAAVATGLLRRGRDVVGIDISSEMLMRAEARMPGRVALATAECLPIASGSLANCYAIWVLHLVNNLTQALVEVKRALAPGGRLVACSVNNGAPNDVIGEIVFRMQHRLLGSSTVMVDGADALESVARRVGLAPRHDLARSVDQIYELSPLAMADTIERRGFSSLERVEPDSWDLIVVPAIDELRALPSPEVPLARRTSHQLIVFERPR